MNVEQLVKRYLPEIKVMQLATAADNQPYACTVHYYSDDEFNFYWRSTPVRRHSQEIKKNPKIAATILVHENTPEENWVVGITVVGIAELIGAELEPRIGAAYIKKLNLKQNILMDIFNDRDPHRFYRLKPTSITLFDSKNLPNDPRQEWILSNEG